MMKPSVNKEYTIAHGQAFLDHFLTIEKNLPHFHPDR